MGCLQEASGVLLSVAKAREPHQGSDLGVVDLGAAPDHLAPRDPEPNMECVPEICSQAMTVAETFLARHQERERQVPQVRKFSTLYWHLKSFRFELGRAFFPCS